MKRVRSVRPACPRVKSNFFFIRVFRVYPRLEISYDSGRFRHRGGKELPSEDGAGGDEAGFGVAAWGMVAGELIDGA